MKTRFLMFCIAGPVSVLFFSGCAHLPSYGDAPLYLNNTHDSGYYAFKQAEKIAKIKAWTLTKAKRHHLKGPALPPVNIFTEEMAVPGAFPFIHKLEVKIINNEGFVDQTFVIPSLHPLYCRWKDLKPFDKIRLDLLKKPNGDELNTASYLIPVLIGEEE